LAIFEIVLIIQFINAACHLGPLVQNLISSEYKVIIANFCFSCI